MNRQRGDGLRLDGVAAGYGARTILGGVSLELPRGALTALLGPGGSGKSTLLCALASLAGGERAPMQPWAAGELPRVTTYRFAQPRTRECRGDALALAQARLRVETWLARHPDSLAPDERAALLDCAEALLRCDEILASAAELLLLDEPDAALAPLVAHALARVLRTRAREGATVVLVTHDLSLVHALADHAVLLIDGVKLDEGPPARLLARPASERVRSFFTWGT